MALKNNNAAYGMVLEAFRAVLCVAPAFFITAAIIISLSLLSAHADNRRVTASILSDLRSGAAVFPKRWDKNLKTGIDTWSDCLVIEIATYGEKDSISSLARANYIRDRAFSHPCKRLRAKLKGSFSQDKMQVVDYWRYWWGSAALLNIVIGIFGISLSSYQVLLKSITYVAILLVVCTAVIRYRRAVWPFLPVVGALTFGFAIPLFGQSIAHAPELITGLLLLFGYMVTGMDRASLKWQFSYVFIVGGMEAYFDLINGNMIAVLICFALVRLLSIWPFEPAHRFQTTTAVIHLMVAYVTGVVSMVLLRIVLHVTLLNQNLFSVLSTWSKALAKHASNKVSDYLLINSRTVNQTLKVLYEQLDVATFPYIGIHGTTLVYEFCGFIYMTTFVWLLWYRKQLEAAQCDRLFAVSLIALIIPAWYCVFAVHDIKHFWMMGRLLSLFFAFAASIVFIINMKRPGRHNRMKIKMYGSQ